MKFRDLRADEVDARISTVSEKGISLLLYKDARCDMRILDEIVGSENWQREHYECKGNLFCRVGIKMPDWNDWVWKSDCGTESYTEKEKGEASDSFKRACFNWGIGRELYTAPFIWIKAGDGVEIKPNTKGGFTCYPCVQAARHTGALAALCDAGLRHGHAGGALGGCGRAGARRGV